ncbi:MAG: helix-turn-helix transcriptional regulator [Prosthecobacter sp.]|nr:helix-turn-helix transcriptional regulator [Prosthecobacter sp.]HBJ85794.1 transcriptional regulator [Verrucomicrobiales bacterium]
MPADSKNIVGARVQAARLRTKPPMTQAQLAEALIKQGVSIDRAGISKIEIGQRSVYDFEVKALSKVLGVTLEWLLKDG